MRVGVALSFLLTTALASSARGQSVQLNWLDGKPPAAQQNVSWGVPWAKGTIQKTTTLALKSADGKNIPMQTWPLAFWPDGSIKWSGHSIAATSEMAGPFTIAPGPVADSAIKLTATQDANAIDIDTGVLKARILKQGANLFESLTIGDRKVAQDGKLIAILEDRSKLESDGIRREVNFASSIKTVTLEQAGPMRAVVKIEGMHASKDRSWLPFVVRLYFNAGSESIRLVHTFIFDGDGNKDFIKGLGLSFSVPFKEQLHNRHVRFIGDGVGDTGVWDQPVRLLPGYRTFPRDQYTEHLAGKRLQDYGDALPANVASVPVWNDFLLSQSGPDSFSIDKRTQAQSSWLHVNNGKRSLGMAVLADVSGGLAVGVKDFWQKYPASIEIDNAASDVGTMKVWLWSPEGQPMDLRHYDIQGHALDTNYEDWKPGWDSAYGIAHTADLTLWAFSEIPSNESLLNMARGSAAPPLPVCSPKYYHDTPVFGFWSLPDKSSPTTKWVEDQLEYLFDFYHAQVEERHWYGFWDFGDIMHNYDFGRHEWRYDVGGWAWTNSELAPDMFLYTMFLRTGRPEIFRMAEAMTRHTSEVDMHHIGPFAPLGSRHNVNHSGDGAKQPRISQVGFKRYYYYLTTDDRVGDLMHEQLDADLTYDKVRAMDPGHVPVPVIEPNLTRPWTNQDMNAWNAAQAQNAPTTGPARGGRRGGRGGGGARGGAARGEQVVDENARFSNVRFGLDWICYAINWTTEWERTGNTIWRDRVMMGMKTIVANSAGETVGGGYFDIIFGGAEDLAQMEPMYDYPEFWAGWAKACEAMASSSGNNMTAPRMAAYAAHFKKDPVLGKRAWDALIGNANVNNPLAKPQLIDGPDVLNPRYDPVFLGASAGWQLHGPASVQWALNAIETLELAKDYLPDWEKSRGNPNP